MFHAWHELTRGRLFVLLSAVLILTVCIAPAGAAADLMPVPVGVHQFRYDPVTAPVLSPDPATARPLGLGSAASGGYTLTLRAALDRFAGPVDIYLFVYAPAFNPDTLYQMTPDNTLQPVSGMPVPWRSSVTEPLDETPLGSIAVAAIQQGIYTFYLAATPHGSIADHYFWETTLSITRGSEAAELASPFGFSGAYASPAIVPKKGSGVTSGSAAQESGPYDDVSYIGPRWVRPGSDIYWHMVQPDHTAATGGPFDWTFIDAFYGSVPPGIHILGTIDPLPWVTNADPAFTPGSWRFASPAAEANYLNFVKAAVDRYNGDGRNDMPGLINPIKYWQVGNEEALRPAASSRYSSKQLDWQGFSRLMEITYKAIKSIDPDAKIGLGGMAGGYVRSGETALPGDLRDFYVPLIRDLNGRYCDFFDIHYYGSAVAGGTTLSPQAWEWQGIRTIYSMLRSELDRSNFSNADIWITETAVPSTTTGEEPFQASSLLKRYVYGLASGVKKIFWWNMIENDIASSADTAFNHMGLAYNGRGAADPGYNVKKLAYYTYKKMTDILEGSDWNAVLKIRESDDVYVYQFRKAARNIWVVWNEAPGPGTVVISGIAAGQVKITEALPEAGSGSGVVDYAAAFRSETRAVNGSTEITLGDKPLFIEEM